MTKEKLSGLNYESTSQKGLMILLAFLQNKPVFCEVNKAYIDCVGEGECMHRGGCVNGKPNKWWILVARKRVSFSIWMCHISLPRIVLLSFMSVFVGLHMLQLKIT